ncbi:AMP binding protein [Mycena filopes]|nr:AMP binding protein [Mycena filopes]
MSPKGTVYTSPHPSVHIPQTSAFTHVFASRGAGDVGGFPGTKKAFVDASSGAFITRAQLRDLALSFGHGLRTHPATKPLARRGDTILIYSPNSLAWPVVLFGSVAAGLRCTTANSAYTSRELAHQYHDSGAKLLITTEDGVQNVREMFVALGVAKREGDARIVVLGRDLRWAGGPSAPRKADAAGLLTMEDLLKGGKMETEEKFDGDVSNETVYLCYSSGTTGKPKTTHLNVVTLIQVLHLSFVMGPPVIIQPRFEPVEFCANIEKYKVTLSLIVPPILVVLARHPAAEKYNVSSLRYLCSGAAPLGKELVHQVKQRLRKIGANCEITQGYGLTETSPTTHILDVEDSETKMGSIGYLLPNLKARLVEDDDGEVDAEEGRPGELWIHGPTVMKGYLNNPSATTNCITPDGWLKTGDVAIRDKDGHYYIVDRRKELIKYKVHPDIADVAVIGVDDIVEATELPRAYVVHAHPAKVQTAAAKAAFAQSVVKWMETKVAKHKFLRGGVGVIDVIPKSAAGKILRRELRDLAKQEASTAVKSKL